MANSDYICVYRQFFEEFAKTTQMEDCRPMRVNFYDLTIDELVGEVMQSCVNYLMERKCPKSLVVPLTKIVVEEFINEAKKQPEEVNTPLKLNRKTHDKISEVCLRYTDNEKLCNLPGPVQETSFSTHSTKHTRRRMEDRLICLPRFNSLHGIRSNSEAGYYGIFDGHGGFNAACYAVAHLHQFLAESTFYPNDPVQAFRQAFEKTESKYNAKDENSGTAVLAILYQPTELKLTVAWVGDSQAMLVNEDSYVMLIDPHKPERTDERKRIEELGGCIIKVQNIYRVSGGLAISRAIGDKSLKPYISAEPEIRVLNLTGSEHFVVMGCDGLWDVVEPQQVIDTVYFEVKKHQGQIDSVAKRLVDLAKENNSTDNISVIVIFLTDPTEISNRSVDASGHRPKILHQNGVIMEANFQTNDKSPFGDPGMNGIYETNGNHFNVQNDSDEDFGPETDVDAVDDVLTLPKNLNPFAKDCWQHAAEQNSSDKLLEFRRRETKGIEDEIVQFGEGREESSKDVDDAESNQLCDEVSSKDNAKPFDAPITNTVADMLADFTDDSNKYIDEINSRKEDADILSSSNSLDQSLDLKIDNFSEKPQDKATDSDLFSFDGNGFSDSFSSKTPQHKNILCNEDRNLKAEERTDKFEMEKESAPEESCGFEEDKSFDSNSTSNKLDELKSNDQQTMDHFAQSEPIDYSGNSSLFGKPPYDFSMDTVVCTGKEDEPSSELLSPSAPALDGELKDETVAESGGEIEDSEDDEWDYIKVGSVVHQIASVEGNTSELVPSSDELCETGKPAMNSPLNPEADEFIPVSALSTSNEINVNVTPKKATPDDLTDIIASSPNWNNMNNVTLPEESAFLNEIKSRPSNIFEKVESPPQEDFASDLNDSQEHMSAESNINNELVVVSEQEPRGLDLASDMTSSFIDPATMGSETEVTKEEFDAMNSPTKHSTVEKRELNLNEIAPKVEKLADAEIPSKMPDLLPPVPPHESLPVTPVLGMMQSSNEEATEAAESMLEPVVSVCDISQRPLLDIQETNVPDYNQRTAPSEVEQVFAEPRISLETDEVTSRTLDKAAVSAETASAVAGTVAAVSAAVVADASASEKLSTKKDVMKAAPKRTCAGVTKTSAKPLLNGTKTSSAAKKSAPSAQTTKAPTPGKIFSSTGGSVSKTAAPKTSTITKTQPKSTTSMTSTVNKAPSRPRPASASSTTSAANRVSKVSQSSKTVTSSLTKTTTTLTTTAKTTTRTSTAPASTILKAKPLTSSATAEKKLPSAVNGDAKSSAKRTEITTKKTGGTTTTTSVSLTARPVTAPTKSTTLKTTVTSTRTVPAKPRTALSSSVTSKSPSAGSKTSPMAKSNSGAEKQAKEVANRLTSKTTSAAKTNGVAQRSTTSTVTKTTRRTPTLTSTPSKMKNHDKTENKAERILEGKVEGIQSSENGGVPLIENNTDINLINSISSK